MIVLFISLWVVLHLGWIFSILSDGIFTISSPCFMYFVIAKLMGYRCSFIFVMISFISLLASISIFTSGFIFNFVSKQALLMFYVRITKIIMIIFIILLIYYFYMNYLYPIFPLTYNLIFIISLIFLFCFYSLRSNLSSYSSLYLSFNLL